MAEELVRLIRAFQAAVVAFEPGLYSGEDCAVLVEELATAEKACAAARVRAAARAGACGAHHDRGFADVSDWLARASGSSSASAKAALDTAAALQEQPAAKAALEAGELSMAQAQELAKTEASCPGSAAGLLGVAKQRSLKTLKEQARDRRMRMVSPEELHASQHRARPFRYWRTALGTVGFTGELPPETGLPIMNRLDAETDRLWKQAHGHGNGAAAGEAMLTTESVSAAERRSALAADAFVRLVETGGKGKAHSADLVIVCDLQAYRRGRAHDGEPCHLIGGGPIPVSLARELGKDAFLKAVHTGTEIHTIAHFGRKTSAVLRTALTLGAPPLFDGITCAVEGCAPQLPPRAGSSRSGRQRRADVHPQRGAQVQASPPGEDRTTLPRAARCRSAEVRFCRRCANGSAPGEFAAPRRNGQHGCSHDPHGPAPGRRRPRQPL